MYSAEVSAWLQGDLERYAQGMAWVIERKDFNDFWPIGLPEAGTAMGADLIEAVDHALAENPSPGPVAAPTALLILFFFSAYGMRSAGWTAGRRLGYARKLLGAVRESKAGDPLNGDGKHLLQRPLLAPAEPHLIEAGAEPDLLPALNALCATLWAYSELFYFCNHRLGTERHGPYPGSEEGRCLVVRSARDLAPARLWPEVSRWPQLPLRLDLVFEWDEGMDVRFDLFSNPLFQHPVSPAVSRVAVLTQDESGQLGVNPGAAVLRGWVAEMREAIAEAAPLVREMSSVDLCLRLHRIMLSAAATACGQNEALASSWDARPGEGRRLGGSREKLKIFYDVRREWTP